MGGVEGSCMWFKTFHEVEFDILDWSEHPKSSLKYINSDPYPKIQTPLQQVTSLNNNSADFLNFLLRKLRSYACR